MAKSPFFWSIVLVLYVLLPAMQKCQVVVQEMSKVLEAYRLEQYHEQGLDKAFVRYQHGYSEKEHQKHHPSANTSSTKQNVFLKMLNSLVSQEGKSNSKGNKHLSFQLDKHTVTLFQNFGFVDKIPESHSAYHSFIAQAIQALISGPATPPPQA